MKHGHPTPPLLMAIGLIVFTVGLFTTDTGKTLMEAFLTYPAPYVIFGVAVMAIAVLVGVPVFYYLMVICIDQPARHNMAWVTKKLFKKVVQVEPFDLIGILDDEPQTK